MSTLVSYSDDNNTNGMKSSVNKIWILLKQMKQTTAKCIFLSAQKIHN